MHSFKQGYRYTMGVSSDHLGTCAEWVVEKDSIRFFDNERKNEFILFSHSQFEAFLLICLSLVSNNGVHKRRIKDKDTFRDLYISFFDSMVKISLQGAGHTVRMTVGSWNAMLESERNKNYFESKVA